MESLLMRAIIWTYVCTPQLLKIIFYFQSVCRKDPICRFVYFELCLLNTFRDVVVLTLFSYNCLWISPVNSYIVLQNELTFTVAKEPLFTYFTSVLYVVPLTVYSYFSVSPPWHEMAFYNLLMCRTKARFPLPELTVRVDGWPVSITRQHGPSWRARVSTIRVDGPCCR